MTALPKEMTQPEKHNVPPQTSPTRLQEYGVGIFISCPTKSALKKALKKQQITVNGEIASTATIITGGETIELNILKGEDSRKKLIFPLRVLFEDEHLAMIHKPGGIAVSGNSFKTIANALPLNLKQSKLPDATTPHPVHRLDYATTGILLVGKTSSSIRSLNMLFDKKEIIKTYFAVTIGEMELTGKITLPVDQKAAESQYEVLETVPSKRFGRLNLLRLYPKTGRRHQLRKHLAGIGTPILGDKDYGKKDLILKGKGLYLHAFSLEFTHPFKGEKLQVKDELPEKFRKIFP